MTETRTALAAVSAYLDDLRATLQAGNATEPSYYPHLQTFLEALAPGITATSNPKRIACGAPDVAISRQTTHGPVTSGYVEAKEPCAPLDRIEQSEQLQRYRTLPNLLLTDFLTFRWYVNGDLRQEARLGELDPGGRLRRASAAEQAQAIALLGAFLAHAPAPVNDARELAERLARLTHLIRGVIVNALAADEASAMLRDLRQAFEQTLVPDQSAEEFADMFAQTLAYGLFAARCNHTESAPFRRLGAAAEIPKTNPFLRLLFNTITGPDLDDEPYAGFVDDLAQLLAETDMKAVLADFGRRSGREDPVIHFYETFLAAYDARLRKVRGVYYTPEPVVSYIVRSVDHLLKTRFDCPAGLADTARTADGQPRVLVLDPACGTGTFLYAVVDHIRETFLQPGNAGMWSGFVREHLLPRLFGFELLMGAYAVAHFKLGMQLAAQDLPAEAQDTWAYDFAGDDRLGVYLTNTLEEAVRRSDMLMARYISDEANAAVRVKRDLPIMVVLGNPPYAGHSANASWRMERVGRPGARQRLRRVRTWIGDRLQTYYEVDGKPLGERNPKWLQDDYVKFIRFGQWRIEQTGAGVLAFITNHGYLDNPTFRGMRQQLMQTFTDIYVLDLHGNARKREQAPDGGPDENVFDIEQGVAIGLFVKAPGQDGPARVHHAELWGEREGKYDSLSQANIETTDWTTLAPQSPFYLFVPQNVDLRAEYERGWKITDAMPVNVLGFQSHRDKFAIAFDDATIQARIADLRDMTLTDIDLRETHGLRDNNGWRLSNARKRLKNDDNWQQWVTRCLYRPFDWRSCYFSTAAMDRPRPELQRHMLQPNLSLNTVRQTRMPHWNHAVVANAPTPAVFVEIKDGSSVFPLYLYPESDEPEVTEDGQHAQPRIGIEKECSQGERLPNFSDSFVRDVCGRLNGQWIADGRPEQAPAEADDPFEITPEDVFHYIYAVLHAPTYRSRYAEFLRIDFPRVPLTSDRALFRTLAAKGAALVSHHLLEAPALADSTVRYPVPGEHLVEKGHPRYLAPGDPDPATNEPLTAGRVYISRDMPRRGQQGQYFEGVPPEVWEFHVGGYQVCDKWLKDRRGRTLTYDDIEHYRRIITALQATLHLMAEIDAAIPAWPLP